MKYEDGFGELKFNFEVDYFLYFLSNEKDGHRGEELFEMGIGKCIDGGDEIENGR